MLGTPGPRIPDTGSQDDYNEAMARGFDSKFVEAQQEEAERRSTPAKPAMTPEARIREEQRRALELTRTRTQQDLSRAVLPAHRRMLEEAMAALDKQIEDL
jgi:hypothetical protein